jgi:hypothetical protein
LWIIYRQTKVEERQIHRSQQSRSHSVQRNVDSHRPSGNKARGSSLSLDSGSSTSSSDSEESTNSARERGLRRNGSESEQSTSISITKSHSNVADTSLGGTVTTEEGAEESQSQTDTPPQLRKEDSQEAPTVATGAGTTNPNWSGHSRSSSSDSLSDRSTPYE